jgi:opacity protein-like surface antigen
MHNTLLRFLTLKVKGLSICLLVTLVFSASALGQMRQMGQTQIATSSAPATHTDENGSAVSSSDAKEKPAEAQPQLHNIDDLKHWALSIHAGVSIPHGNLNNVFNPGPNLAFDVEYRINRTFSVEGIYGYHRFNGERFGAFTVTDLNLHQFSVNGKVYGPGASTRPFLNFGGGVYVFTPGVSTHGGLNVGVGVQHDVTPGFAVEGVYNFHNVFTSGSSTRFSSVQGGVRFRF